ncbi:MAG: Uma2 family endonuclease, partial [Candidatus Tectomicrobia bacterium]|nr:Uma2 family endonuclease [Candidatus Tectomicrobia bacterium]
DDCFYIQHHAAVLGKTRLNLTVDPPPDLVLEVDVTSSTALHAYTALQVPEIWRYHHGTLQIAVWRNGQYETSAHSPTFPGIPVIEGIAPCLEMSRHQGTVPALRAFRRWVRSQVERLQGGA